MKPYAVLFFSLFCLSFSPSTEKAAIDKASNGFYISVKDLTDRTYHEFIVKSKDSVDIIFDNYFESELELGSLDYPISIFNSKLDFYVARVNVIEKSNGKLGFKHLKYADVYNKKKKTKRESPPEWIVPRN